MRVKLWYFITAKVLEVIGLVMLIWSWFWYTSLVGVGMLHIWPSLLDEPLPHCVGDFFMAGLLPQLVIFISTICGAFIYTELVPWWIDINEDYLS